MGTVVRWDLFCKVQKIFYECMTLKPKLQKRKKKRERNTAVVPGYFPIMGRMLSISLQSIMSNRLSGTLF